MAKIILERTLITLHNLIKHYDGLHAVNGISLEIPSNVIYGIIGKSGAGKSTLVRLISLLESPQSGEIYFDSDRVDNLHGKALLERRHRLGMIFQNFNLFSSRNVFGNIAYPLEIVGKGKSEIRARVCQLLELVGLTDKETNAISQLSGGQKQRVAIARALANYPEILFCDEATSALDPQTTTSILRLIKDIQSQMNLTVVMITHQMEVVREICNYVSVIDSGQIVESGNVNDIFSHPHTKVTRELMSMLKPLENKLDSEIPNSASCYQLYFRGKNTTKPLLSQVIRGFQIDVVIMEGTINNINEEFTGELVVKFIGTSDNIESAKRRLQELNVLIEAVND